MKYFKGKVKAAEKEREKEKKFKSRKDEDEGPVGPANGFKMAQITEDQIKEFKDYLPLIEVLCNPGLRLRHWQKVNRQ